MPLPRRYPAPASHGRISDDTTAARPVFQKQDPSVLCRGITRDPMSDRDGLLRRQKRPRTPPRKRGQFPEGWPVTGGGAPWRMPPAGSVYVSLGSSAVTTPGNDDGERRRKPGQADYRQCVTCVT